ncbi:hypothetical protein AGRA3207_003671 [Actinomadura graeca]|uniref:DUF3592 domain-containing protein n=1 Tax=Actinomadura graeca TaxID=2750812 RepID=A0ABX8QV82_9ACTN|nr:hypothetical protein [Actinomadura graeca]QXJ22637.1 hypothetical protein AGRA3207_003671 [Actinomadura graeca]
MASPGSWTRLDRLRRRAGFDNSPLRRDVDRRQWMLGLALLMLFLSLAPPLGLRAGQAVYASGVRAERHEAANRRRVDATVVEVKGQRHRSEVTVTWSGADGTRRTGSYTTWREATVGGRRTVWADSSAVSDVAPRPHARTVGDAVAGGVGAALVLGLPLLLVYVLARYRFDRRRYRLWDAEWARWDPQNIA